MRPKTALLALAFYNVVQNTMLRNRGYVVGNVLASGGGLLWAKRSGLEWGELGLSSKEIWSGLEYGLAVATGAGLIARQLGAVPLVGAVLDDERLTDVSDREVQCRILVRFPFGTALFEEVWFRGLLPASLRKHGVNRPDLVSNVAFAVWHLIPASHAISANPRGPALDALDRTGLIVVASVVSGLGGLGFAALRNISSSLIAPWAAHAAINGLTLRVGVKLQRARRAD